MDQDTLLQAYREAREAHGPDHLAIGRELGRRGADRHDVAYLTTILGVHSERSRRLRAGFAAEGGYHR